MASVDFAQAQERLEARRRAREAETRALQAQLQASHASSAALDRLPSPLARIGRTGQDVWAAISGREGTRPTFRVGQVDAELLDEELLELLKGQVGEALKYFGSHLKDDWSPEILLGLRAVLFKLTIWDHDASYGASLQNLRYADARNKSLTHKPPTKTQKSLYGLFSVAGRYAYEKWDHWLIDQEGGYDEPSPHIRLFTRLTSLTSSTYSFAAFASFLIFLFNGRHRTLLDRLLRLRLEPVTSHVGREVSFEYLNRQLVWHAFTEFLLFLLPLVGIRRWRRWLARAWRRVRRMIALRNFLPGSSSPDSSDLDLKPAGELAFLPERTCAICYQDQNPTGSSSGEAELLAASAAGGGGVVGSAQTDVTNPYEAIPCGCIYCFVCIATRLEAETADGGDADGWTCLRCGAAVRACKPWAGDVLEEASSTSRPGSGKSVGFADEEGDGLSRIAPVPVADDIETQVSRALRGAAEEEGVDSTTLNGSGSAAWSEVERVEGEADGEREDQEAERDGDENGDYDEEDEDEDEEQEEIEEEQY